MTAAAKKKQAYLNCLRFLHHSPEGKSRTYLYWIKQRTRWSAIERKRNP